MTWRQFVVREVVGVFRARELVEVDNELAHQWGLEAETTFKLVLENHNGEFFQLDRCQGKNNLSDYIYINPSVCKTLGVKDGDRVMVCPAESANVEITYTIPGPLRVLDPPKPRSE